MGESNNIAKQSEERNFIGQALLQKNLKDEATLILKCVLMCIDMELANQQETKQKAILRFHVVFFCNSNYGIIIIIETAFSYLDCDIKISYLLYFFLKC